MPRPSLHQDSQNPGASKGRLRLLRADAARLVVWCMTLSVVVWALPVPGQVILSPPTYFNAFCDASAAVAVGSNLVAIADDEGNHIRLYRADLGGMPLQTLNLTSFIRATGKFPEADLEGAAWLGDKIFWISSHGRNREGKYRPNRHCFFATQVRWSSNRPPELVPVGLCYKYLLTDLLWDPRYRPFNLAAASTRAPKTKNALNIEGLCATAETNLLIGFRNPIPNGRALLAPLLNPTAVIAGQSARFGPPLLLDLGGLGVRDLGYADGRTYILAGPFDTEKKFRLFRWRGGGTGPEALPELDVRDLTPEALVLYPGETPIQLFSDDGTVKIGGVECKTAPLAARRFRAVWYQP